MNKNTVIFVLVAFLGFAACSAVGFFNGYQVGWQAHSDKVNRDYAERQAKAQRQQVKDTEKATKAEVSGQNKQNVIIKEVVRYVARDNPDKCIFDDTRLQLKQRAVTNANAIEGYDDAAVSVR